MAPIARRSYRAAEKATQLRRIDHALPWLFRFCKLRRLGVSVNVGRPRTRRHRSMNWFRSRIRSGARLALFALAFQMAVSFGHMHRDDLGLPPLPDADQTHFAASTAAATAPVPEHHQPAAPDDYCPICASMALIATLLPSLPPVLITPDPIRRVWPMQMPVRSVSLQAALSFQARAPPSL